MTLGRIATTLGTGTAALALVGLTTFAAAGSAAADPSGYPGGYPGGYGNGGTPGGISTTNPTSGGPVTVTASCTSGSGATLTFDGKQIASAPVSGGTAVLTGTVPSGISGAHTVLATCDDGQTYSFAVNVAAAGSSAAPSGALASTGAQVVTATGVGIVLLGGGFALVVLARRRRPVA